MTLVSIIVPTRNEEAYIQKTLDSLLVQIQGREDAEILCVDGMSADRTREIIGQYMQNDPRIRLIDNPGIILAKALNIGVRSARGSIILRMDCHAECSPTYVEKNIEVLQRTGAQCVGGYLTTLPGKDTPVAFAIAAALSSAFGVGGCRSRTRAGKEEESDEATFGCFPREVFDRWGLFDERLSRNQDMEHFCRIRRNGGRIIISPEISATYYARSTYRGLRKQAFGNGLWGPYTLYLLGFGLKLRHLAPMFFVMSLALGAVAGFFWKPAWLLLGAELAVYLCAGAGMAVKAAKKTGSNPFLVMAAFVSLHLAYGLGSLVGLIGAPVKFGLNQAFWRGGKKRPARTG